MSVILYSYFSAISEGIGNADDMAKASDWINKGDCDFSKSLHDFRERHENKLSERQWRAAIAGSQGKRLKFRSKSATQPVSRPEPSAVKAIHNPRRPLTPHERTVLAANLAKHSLPPTDGTANALYDAHDAAGLDVQHALDDSKARAKDAANDAFAQVAQALPQVGQGGRIDWQRVREIAREEVERRIEPVIIDKVIVDKGGVQRTLDGAVTHPNFSKLAAASALRDFTGQRLNCLLVGPTGTGKSYACRQLAKLFDLPFFFQSQADESFALVGYERVNGEMKYTPFVTAFRDGGICLLDELDRYSPKAVTALNAALANGEMTLDNGEVIKRHPDFVCVGAANTYGMGGSSDFTAAERLDLSTISRFSVRIDWFVHADTEDAIAAAKADDGDMARHWLAECRKVRSACERLSLPYLADQRAVEAGSQLLAAGMPLDDVRSLTYLAPLDADQRRAVLALI